MKRIVVYVLALIIPLGIAYHYFHFYHDHNSFSIQCVFHLATGFWCPGCGGQRAFAFLLHGEVLKSLRYNLLLPFFIPFVLYVYYLIIEGIILGNKKALNAFHITPKTATFFVIFLIVYFILRNIPISPFIYLAPPAN